MIEAMGATREATIVCWRASARSQQLVDAHRGSLGRRDTWRVDRGRWRV
jgi:hypothetical protein